MTYQPQSKNEPINAETSPGDKLDKSRQLTRDMDDKVTKGAVDLMRRGSGGSQN